MAVIDPAIRCVRVTHHSIFVRSIRCRLQQCVMSARHTLLHLPLTGNHRRLRPQWWINGKHGQRNGTTLCLLVNPVSTCSITMVGFEFGDTEGRGC
ncbi:hypothetical protein TNCV_1442221 [Trichonephila clavipes]|uniref:Uncharacterized protein n=1 Tax=Trichonephila clavipes TaxID=2585209 RepID=A0A8X6RKE4_TRICX|nr:hypothetical protein TNCV_1442221 [Trichonephila clavipes]